MSTLEPTLHAILSTSLDPAIAMRHDGSIAAWNSVAEQTFGWTFQEVDGRRLSEFIIPPELRSRHERGLERYLETGVATALGKYIEVTAIDRAGRRFPVELSTTELKLEDGHLFVGFIRDITARKDADQKIRDITERLELAVRAHSIGVFDTDVKREQVKWSEELELIYGYLPGTFETTLAAWRRHVFSSDLSRIKARFKKAVETQASEISYSYRMTRCDGDVRDIEASARFFYDAAGNNIRRVGVNIDVTERKMAERRLADTQSELIHVSRLNSLGALASSLSHELNQPLAAVANYISAARSLVQQQQQGMATGTQAVETLQLASESALRAGELIKHLRTMSAKGVNDPICVSFSEIVHVTARIALHDHSHLPITLTVDVDSEADAVFTDPVLLQQVVFNLMRNAAEAMQDAGGTITVRATVTSSRECLVQIEDTGPGLEPEIASNLFTAFVSTKSDGMGVGLSICRTIIENSGGRIWAETSEAGAKFFFTLPRPRKQRTVDG
ncbi:MAG: PAS domain S-box protein [Pseudomonadota bacterium]